MYVHRYTEGEHAFLAIHGWAGDHREFAPLALAAPPGARLLSVDLPGHGASPAIWPLDLEAVAAEIVDLLESEGGGTCLGFCSGAVLAMMAAQRRPSVVHRLVLIEPFGYLPLYFRIFLWGALGRFFYRWAFLRPTGSAWVNRLLRARQRSRADFTAAFDRVSPDLALAYLQAFARIGSVRRFADLAMPILLVRGEHTFRAVARSVAVMRAMWPQAELCVLSGTGHLMTGAALRTLANTIFASTHTRLALR